MRDEALRVAERLVAEHGVANVSIEDIAAGVGVSRATLYRQVGGRDDIVMALTMRRFDEWVDAVVRRAARSTTAGDMIIEAVLVTVHSVRREPSLGTLFAAG